VKPWGHNASKSSSLDDLLVDPYSCKMNPKAADVAECGPSDSPPMPLDWRFSQVFGERTAGEDVQEGTYFFPFLVLFGIQSIFFWLKLLFPRVLL
jgi:hypothetical protein